MLNKLHITEDTGTNPTTWIVSFSRPEFQGGDSIVIDEGTAIEILNVKEKIGPEIKELKSTISDYEEIVKNLTEERDEYKNVLGEIVDIGRKLV